MRHSGYVEKAWGYELIFATNDDYCGKILHFRKAGNKFSMHFHLKKDETWFVSSGSFRCITIDTETGKQHPKILSIGDSHRNPPGLPHQLIALEDDSEIFETSTPDFIEDNYRVFPGDSQIAKRVFVNGTFDILHIGHLELLSFAKQQGDHLTVALDSDERVKEKKGSTRPINTLEERVKMMESIRYVDVVQTFSSDEELEHILCELRPDIMIVGSDWVGKPIIGSKFAKKVIFFERIPNVSTTKKIQSISNR